MNTLLRTILVSGITLSTAWFSIGTHADESACPAAFEPELKRLHSSKTESPCNHFASASAIVVVNTASHCGFTKQFTGLEALYEKYKDQGLVILGFPSDSFNQEEATEAGTANVCFVNYGVTFPMYAPVSVKGENAHPIFAYLREQANEPGWNFNKYLLSKGKVTRYGSTTTPLDSRLEDDIRTALAP